MSNSLQALLAHATTHEALQRTSWNSDEVFLLEAVHMLFVYNSANDTLFHINTTANEFLILTRLLHVPPREIIPFQELFPFASEQIGESPTPLQRHISRLKKKLPPTWMISCETGFGYYLWERASQKEEVWTSITA
jgi:DNA-binding response OmpR family regulator